MKNRTSNWLYWIAQLCGWLVFFGLSVFVNYSTGELDAETLFLIAGIAFSGFAISHVFRMVIVRTRLPNKPLQRQLIGLLVMLLTGSVVQSVCQILITAIFSSISLEKELKVSIIIMYLLNWAIIYAVWLMLYMFYQVMQKQRLKVIQELKLTALQNEIELTNLRSQLNPHFMFNSMNSIRALIDENPPTAKVAVTKLAGLLRSALQFGKRNFITLGEELDLVNDYLYLEKMRFEERLEFSFDIAGEMKEIAFPPLMLQTLVENAIKHGISTLPGGGQVRITGAVNGPFYQLKITNTGTLHKPSRDGGIGLSNTAKRLRILYGNEAGINLYQQGDGVCTELNIPIKKQQV